MSHIPRFAAYAAAFEKSYENDDWAALTPSFTEGAVYDAGLADYLGGRIEGRDAIFAHFKRVLDGFDRRFASREIALVEGPTEADDTVTIVGTATYRADGVPDLVLTLEESATFDGDRISLLEDRYDPEAAKDAIAYIEAHREKLGLDV